MYHISCCETNRCDDPHESRDWDNGNVNILNRRKDKNPSKDRSRHGTTMGTDTDETWPKSNDGTISSAPASLANGPHWTSVVLFIPIIWSFNYRRKTVKEASCRAIYDADQVTKRKHHNFIFISLCLFQIKHLIFLCIDIQRYELSTNIL